MNFFRALGHVNVRGPLLEATLLFALSLPLMIMFHTKIVFILPLVTAIILGYILRAVPEIFEKSSEMPILNGGSFALDFARGLITLVVGVLYSLPAYVAMDRLNVFLFSKGYLTVSDKNFLVIMVFCLGTLSFLAISVGIIRFSMTKDVRVYLNLPYNIYLIVSHFEASFSFVVNLLVSLVVLAVGFISCLAPGIIFFPIWIFVLCYLLACYARDLGLAPMKEKRKNDLLSSQLEKQKVG